MMQNMEMMQNLENTLSSTPSVSTSSIGKELDFTLNQRAAPCRCTGEGEVARKYTQLWLRIPAPPRC